MGTLAAALLLAGCGSVSADDGGEPGGGGSDRDDALVGRPFVSSRFSLTFNDGTMSARSGCNTMFAPYNVVDGRLTLTGPLGGTEMACEDPLMAYDERLADFLADDPAYELVEDTLTLTGADTTIELVDEEVAVPDVALTGTEWALEGIVSGSDETGVVGSVPAGVRSTLRFTADNKLLAELGCNGGGGEVTFTDSTLVVRDFAQTLMACGGAKDQVERTVAGVLGGDAEIGYVVDAETLTLRAGATGLIYRAG